MHKIIFLFLAFILILLVKSPLSAQHERPVKFERYSIEDGLSSNRIYSMAQDDRGYLWIGTEAGFSRYDGYEFETYRKVLGDENSLINNWVNAIYADKNGNIWVGTQNGLSRFDPVRRHFYNDNELPGQMVSCIFESSSGEIWFGTNNGLAKYDTGSNSFISPWEDIEDNISLSEVTINSISEDKNGKLLLATGTLGVILLNPKENKTSNFSDLYPELSFPSKNIPEILVASNGEIWMGFLPDLGVGRFNTETGNLKVYSYDSVNQPGIWNRISGIIETKDHTIWITSYHSPYFESGLHRFDEKTEKFTRYTRDPYDPSSLSWMYSQCLFEDSKENLWVGTSRGLNKADMRKWLMGHLNVYPMDPYHLLNNFYGIEEVEEDLLWLGNDGEGYLEWDRKNNTKTVNENDGIFRQAGIHAIQKDVDGAIWFGLSGTGLVRMDRKTGERKEFKHLPGDSTSLAGNYVTDILIDHKEQMWICTSNGLSRYNRADENFTNWRKGEGKYQMTGNSLSSIFEDSKGNLWIGTTKHVYDFKPTYGTGLMKFDPQTNLFTTYVHDPDNSESISSDVVFSIAEDLNENIWVGTDHGLNRLDPYKQKFELFLVPDGLPHPKVIGILVDDSGIIWLSTLNGLSRFDPATKTFRNYSTDDGVQASRFNEHSYFKTSKGELIFGGVAGANYFYPSEVTKDTVIPEVYITEFMVKNQAFKFDETFDESSSLKLKWKENSVSWEFVSINFRTPEQSQYQYRLDGYQDEWVSVGTRRFVDYTNLRSGNYTFRVRVTNAEGISSVEDATMSIRIMPPFWLAWYAYVFYIILIILLFILLDRIQRKKFIRKERERTRDRELEQAREIEKAYTELKSTQSQLIQSEKMASLGELTAGIAHEIQNPLNFVNNFSEVSSELLDEMLEEIEAGQTDDVKEITDDIKQNLAKISHHGKRADSIVKGMLQHSRTSDGKKELTDINILADEYLRLSYHGLRAKEKSFNADFSMEAEKNLPKIQVVPQEIGRVLLNLINNAFYAVSDKGKMGYEGYKPIVIVSTHKNGESIEIRVKDNGNGVPENIKEKIFQPFFTTKPSGQGTGLGLSMSYDIITKGHRGQMDVISKTGKGSEFIILLPIK